MQERVEKQHHDHNEHDEQTQLNEWRIESLRTLSKVVHVLDNMRTHASILERELRAAQRTHELSAL